MTPGTRLIRWAALLVPRYRRAAWRREWEGEVAHAWRRMRREGRPSPFRVARLYLRIGACVIDATWERREEMRLTGLATDVRHALRSLGRNPTFTGIAVLTIALGIGANTAVFTIADGVLFSPLRFEDPDALVSITHLGRDGQDELPSSTGLYLVYREHASSLEDIALWSTSAVNFVADGEAERIVVQAVTPGFFGILGVDAALGRTFFEEEGLPDAERVVVLSDGFWRSVLGADPAVLDRTVDINGIPRRVVGVMPPGFGYPDTEPRLWMPITIDPAQAPLASFGTNAVGRLAEGSSVQSLQTDIDGLITRLPELFPESGSVQFLQEVNLRGVVRPLKTELVGDLTRTLWVLLATVGFVLLIACANVANLLLVRAEGRQRELALRVSVGAGRLDVLRAFMTESVLLAAAGGVLGTAVAFVAVRGALAMAPAGLPRIAEIGVDLRVLGFSAAVTAACALFFGFFPLLRYGADDLAGQLREGAGRGSTSGKQRLRSGLVVLQMALALVLLVGSGLMFRSFRELRAVDPGFHAADVLTARINVPTGEIEGWEETSAFYRQLRERLVGQPGIEGVGYASGAPLAGGVGFFSIEVEDHPRAPGELPVLAFNNFAGPGYFEAIDIPLLEGRTFEEGDGAEGARSVVVSRAFAQEWWPNQSPLGRRLRLGFDGEDWYQVVGMVGDARYVGLAEGPEAMVYWPMTIGPADAPQPMRGLDVVLETGADPASFIALLRRELAAVNPRIPLSNPRPMDAVVASEMSSVSFTVTMLGSASGIALILGLVGIYGVISYVVSQRTREIGVRIALGATGPSVRDMVVREGLVLAGLGVGIGLLGATALSRFMASLLFGVTARDPLTYGAVAVAMIVVALAASWVPATRASRVDPATALRAD